MAGKPVGTMYAEIDLDLTPMERKLKTAYEKTVEGTQKFEQSFKQLGIQSDRMFESQKQMALVSYNAIKNSAQSTAQDIIRAEEAKNAKIKALNEQQFGHHNSMLATLKSNWIATAAVVGSAMIAMGKAWSMLKEGAEYDEQIGLLNNLATKYKTTADSIVESMKRASSGQIANADLMKVALSGIGRDLKPEQLINLADAAKTLGDVVGGSATEALQNLTQALVTGRERGVIGYTGKTLALSETFGELESKMTAAEKSLAMYNMIMIRNLELQQQQKKAVDDTADTIEKVEAKYKNLQLTVSRTWKAIVVSAVEGASAWADLMRMMFGKTGTTGEGVYVVPEIPKTNATDEYIAKLKKENEELIKQLKTRNSNADAAKEAAAKQKAAYESIAEATRKAQYEIDSVGKNQYEKDVARIESQAKKYRDARVDEVTIAKYVAKEKDLAERKYNEHKADLARKAADEAISEMEKEVNAGVKESEESLKRIEEVKKAKYEMYKSINEFGQEYYDASVDLIEEQAQKYRDLGIEEVEIAKWVAEQKGQLEYDLFKKKTDYITDGLSQLESSFTAIANCYDEGSSAANRWKEAAKAMEIAQKAVAVVQAVAAIATQGLGDPYTAFARVAAMAATMGALLASIGTSINGSSTSSAAASSATWQNSDSTKLGAESGDYSESVTASYELLKDTYDLEDTKLTQIYEEVKDLNNNIIGLVTSYIKTGGVDSSGYSWSLGSSDLYSLAGLGVVSDATVGKTISQLIGIASADPFTTMTHQILEALTGGALGNNIGKFISKIFGGSSETEVTNAGIYLGQMFVAQLVNGMTASVQQWVKTKTTTDGGWFHSDSVEYNEYFKSLDSSVSSMFTQVFSSMSESLVTMAEEFGVDTRVALDYVFQSAKIDLNGQTTDEISETLTTYFSDLADTAVEDLFGVIVSAYQELDEGLYETAVRLIKDKNYVENILELTNQSFSGRVDSLIKFSESLVSFFDDLESFLEAASSYYDAFFTDAEKQADLQDSLTNALKYYNMELPTARDGYRDLVESLNLTTSSGQEAYAVLLGLAESADEYYTYLEEAEQDAADAAAELTEELEGLTQTISDWLDSLTTSDLYPGGTSAAAYTAEYEKLLGGVSMSDTETVNDFLDFASSYLSFMQDYTGGSESYQTIYDKVVADVEAIQSAILKELYGDVYSLQGHASGGLTSGLSLAGEIGAEWVVPTYEPQRSSFLKDVGVDSEAIGQSIARTLMNESSGGSANGKDIHVHLYIDKKEITGAVIQGIKSGDDDLIKNIKKVMH